MKYTIIASLLLLFQIDVSAQSLFKQSGLKASETNYYTAFAPSSSSTTTYNRIYFSMGDSLINGKMYQKIYKRQKLKQRYNNNGNVTETETFICDSLFYLVYQADDHKVYKYNSTLNIDDLLYEYGLNVGDTLSPSSILHFDPFNLNYRLTVVGVDTIYNSNVPRRVLNLKYTNTEEQQFSLIEGIGSTRGVFAPFIQLHPNAGTVIYRLQCLNDQETNELLFQNAECFDFECPISSIPDVSDLNKINLNPTYSTNGIFNLYFSSDQKQNFSYRVFDPTGRLIDSRAMKSNDNEILIKGVANGIYYISVDVSDTIKTFKVLLNQN